MSVSHVQLIKKYFDNLWKTFSSFLSNFNELLSLFIYGQPYKKLIKDLNWPISNSYDLVFKKVDQLLNSKKTRVMIISIDLFDIIIIIDNNHCFYFSFVDLFFWRNF
jgi:hypothetical protein